MVYARNVHYLRNLNQEPVLSEDYINEDDLAKDLEQFTNTNFFDIDAGQTTDYQAPPIKPDTAFETASVSEVVSPLDEFSATNLDFMGDFSFTDYPSNFTSPTIQTFPDPLNLQPIQPSPHSAYPSHVAHQPGYVPNTGTFPAQTQQGIVGSGVGVGVGEKRKAEHQTVTNSSSRHLSFEEQSRHAAEEDKRKRNTAASARFRVKKKQREQALEKSAKEMSDKVSMLEARISALETENKWLKSLVTEKHGTGKDDFLNRVLKEFSSAQENGKSGGDRHSDHGDDISSRRSSSSGSSSIASSITAAPAGSDDGSTNLLKRARKKE